MSDSLEIERNVFYLAALHCPAGKTSLLLSYMMVLPDVIMSMRQSGLVPER